MTWPDLGEERRLVAVPVAPAAARLCWSDLATARSHRPAAITTATAPPQFYDQRNQPAAAALFAATSQPPTPVHTTEAAPIQFTPVEGHSDRTSHARTGVNCYTVLNQPWLVVLDVNYGGSTGFGRAYPPAARRSVAWSNCADCPPPPGSVCRRQGKAARGAIEGASCRSGFHPCWRRFCSPKPSVAGAAAMAWPSAALLNRHPPLRPTLPHAVGPCRSKALYEQRFNPRLHPSDSLPLIFSRSSGHLVPPGSDREMPALGQPTGVRGKVPPANFAQRGTHGSQRAGQLEFLDATGAFCRRHFAPVSFLQPGWARSSAFGWVADQHSRPGILLIIGAP